MSAFEYIWTAVFVVGWLTVSALMIQTAWSGKFWFYRKGAAGKIWPPLRANSPIRFWGVWTALAWPFLLLPPLAMLGWALSG
jgi:hypothetical protein